ncbi:TPA: hypothetical protein SMQ04_000113 [Pseudomonas putida]|nr:hypothetical protein [Pseudomonas putida]
MVEGHKEFHGVHYWLSASSEGRDGWYGEANVRIKVGDDYAHQTLKMPEQRRTDSEAMTSAEEYLKALCLSGVLKGLIPQAFD